jgi:acetyl esterase/lipase
MSWQSRILNAVLHLGKWQASHRDADSVKSMMRLSLNRLAELEVQPSWVRVRDELIAGVPCEWVSVAETAADAGVILYMHGGGFVAGSPASHRDLAWRLSRASGLRTLLVDYRLAPEYSYPAQLDDCMAVYRALLDGGLPPSQLAVVGDSAGGNLALVTVLRAQRQQLPLPAAVIALSPWGDLTHSGESIVTNAKTDHMIPVHLIDQIAAMYVGSGSEGNIGAQDDLQQPDLSPVFADYTGFPPLMLHAAQEEVLRDDALRIHDRADAVGVDVTCHIWPKVPHAFPVFAQYLPEGRSAIRRMAEFLQQHMAA